MTASGSKLELIGGGCTIGTGDGNRAKLACHQLQPRRYTPMVDGEDEAAPAVGGASVSPATATDVKTLLAGRLGVRASLVTATTWMSPTSRRAAPS